MVYCKEINCQYHSILKGCVKYNDPAAWCVKFIPLDEMSMHDKRIKTKSPKTQSQIVDDIDHQQFKEYSQKKLTKTPFIVEDEYMSLFNVLMDALSQAQNGKGKERHAKHKERFENQKICEIARRVGVGYQTGQAIKKAEESAILGGVRGIAELLGAINYLAAAVIVMREEIDAENSENKK